MTRWAGFVGLTALLISVLLLLTRATERMVESDSRIQTENRTSRTTESIEQIPSVDSSGRSSPVDSTLSTSGDSGRPPSSSDSTAASVSVEGIDSPSVDGSSFDPETSLTASPESTASSGEGSLSTGALVVNIALTQGLVAIVVLVGAWYFDVPLRALGIAGDSPIVAVATGLALGLVLWLASEVTTALSEAAGFGADEGLRRLLAPGTTGGWIALLGFALPIVAVSEELLFRAAAIGVPATGSGTSPWALSIVSSVAFGFCHGIQGRAGVLVTGVLGFVLAAAYVYTGSLLVVIVAHYVLNATEFLVHEGLGVDPIGT